jgi:hypothetical protein
MVVISHPYRECDIRGDPSKGREMEVNSMWNAPWTRSEAQSEAIPGLLRLSQSGA